MSSTQSKTKGNKSKEGIPASQIAWSSAVIVHALELKGQGKVDEAVAYRVQEMNTWETTIAPTLENISDVNALKQVRGVLSPIIHNTELFFRRYPSTSPMQFTTKRKRSELPTTPVIPAARLQARLILQLNPRCFRLLL